MEARIARWYGPTWRCSPTPRHGITSLASSPARLRDETSAWWRTVIYDDVLP